MDRSHLRNNIFRGVLIVAGVLFVHLIGVYLYEGGQNQGVRGGSMSIGLIGEAPKIPNPLAYGKNRQEDLILKFLFRGLIQYDSENETSENGNIVGDLANCDISNLAEVSCTLRPDKVWSDNTPIQADDVVGSIQAFRNNGTSEKMRSFLKNVEITTDESGTIRLKAKEKNSLMLDILTYPIIRSDMIERIRTDRLSADAYVTSGGYIFSKNEHNDQYGYDRITLIRNENTLQENWLDKYHFVFFPDQGSLERGTDVLNLIVPSVKKETMQLPPRFGNYRYNMQEYIGLFANTDTITDRQLRQHLLTQAYVSIEKHIDKSELAVHEILGVPSHLTEIPVEKSLPDIMREKGWRKPGEVIDMLTKDNGMLTTTELDIQTPAFIDLPLKKNIMFLSSPEGNISLGGKAHKNTVAVTINGYRLQEYITGSERFIYKPSLENGTLQEGKNTYQVAFTAEDGSTSVVDTVTVYFTKDSALIPDMENNAKSEALVQANNDDKISERLAKNQALRDQYTGLDPRYYYNDKLEPYTLSITYVSEPSSISEYTRRISEAFTGLGIKIELSPLDSKGLATMLQNGEKKYDFILVGFEASGRLSRIGQVFLSSEAKSGINFAKIESKKLDELFAKLRISTTNDDTEGLKKEIQEYFDTEAFFLPVSSPLHTLYIDKNLKGIGKIPLFQDITSLYGVIRGATIKEDYELDLSSKSVKGFFGWIGKTAIGK